MLPAQAANPQRSFNMTTLYKTLQSELNKTVEERDKVIKEREKHQFETESYRLYDDLSIAERAKVIVLETAMEREMNSSGAKEAIDQFNNGLITLKELVNKLVEIELTLSK